MFLPRISLTLLISILLMACGSNPKPTRVIYVSIPPLKYLAQQIADPGATIEVFVPESSSPESYEPNARQIQALTGATIYLSTGLIDFEQVLEGKIRELSPHTIYLNLSTGLDLIEGNCSNHSSVSTAHQHGVDPHIWLSPRLMKQMGFQVADRLSQLTPDSAYLYRERAERFALQADSLDRYIQQTLSGSHRRQFAIGHTSLTYFARDYGLTQIAIEADGKEPSVQTLTHLVDSLQRIGVTGVLYQRQTSDAAARTVVRELPNGRALEFDPLAENWNQNLRRLTDSLRTILNH